MRLSFRAASIAAASFVALTGIVFAGPSRAFETSAIPVTSTYLDHARAFVETGELALEPVEPLPAEAEATPAEPVAAHAAVPAEIAPEPEPKPVRRTLAGLVADYGATRTADAEHECLATAVYFESKGESLEGQLSVAEVVLNRARSPRFPSTICGVVKQRGQFSFVRRGRFPAIARASAAWKKAVAVARVAREDLADSPATKALFFHARYVRPGWRGLTRVATVGNHIFYR